MAATLRNPAKQLVLACVLLLTCVHMTLSARNFLALYFGESDNPSRLRFAARLAPANAELQYRLGKYSAFVENDPATAIRFYQSAARLNPYNARYWLDLASAQQITEDSAGQQHSLENAVRANPTNPDVAWEAGNFFLVQGDLERAFSLMRVVVENQTNMAPLALRLCWRSTPEVDTILSKVVPSSPEPHLAFLDFLIQQKNIEGANKVWQRLVSLHQAFEIRYVFEYVKFLISEGQVDQARGAWQQSAPLLGLSAYLPSTNLIVNGQFSQDVLNGAFDWNYQIQRGVALALDPVQFHSAQRSLSITFDSAGLSDAGVYQIVPVEPNLQYEFTAYYKADSMQGAGGPVITIRDFYSSQTYFIGEEMKDTDIWKPVSTVFTTGPGSKLLVVRIERVPSGNAIRGRLWVDDFELTPK
ncbi:MAG TPA: carbohydrate binding domain-containing protein [Terriglobales bacterium]|jgi:tetratricopeptide (TPR) repeat protein|nr:carbohydrate binding domain-containing protein [Terriglobales bacterium]